MSCILGGKGIYVWSDWFLLSNYSLLPLTRYNYYYYYYYYITMGYKSTYQELVCKQPPSFAKRGEYKIPNLKKPLGRGSTGKVVKAKWMDRGVEKKVALKYVFSSHCFPFLLLHIYTYG